MKDSSGIQDNQVKERCLFGGQERFAEDLHLLFQLLNAKLLQISVIIGYAA